MPNSNALGGDSSTGVRSLSQVRTSVRQIATAAGATLRTASPYTVVSGAAAAAPPTTTVGKNLSDTASFQWAPAASPPADAPLTSQVGKDISDTAVSQF